VLVGRWIGESAALGGATAIGFGIGAAVVVWGRGVDGWMPFAFFVLAAILLGAIFLSLASAVAAACERRVVALGVGIFIWFFFVLLYDGVALSFAGWITGSLGGRVLFASVFGNPADVIRVATLSIAGTPNVLGAAGDAWIRFLGGTAGATAAAAAALLAWTILPLFAAVRILRVRDL
jgi:Cu-processing system permease protein